MSNAPQLLNDCFAHDRRRLLAGEALELLRQRVRPVAPTESVPLVAADGRFLAESVTSGRDVPAFDNVAVDGFAFAHASLTPGAPTRLTLVEGRAAAGHAWTGQLPTGCAIQVLTGAPMPDGADTALMQEDASLEGGAVVIPPGVKVGANRRRAGEDVRRGQTVLDPGQRLRPQDIALAAALGRARLRVYRPLRVALLSTGDELREPGAALAPGATYDVNRVMLRTLLQRQGAIVSDLGILPDHAKTIQAALAWAAAGHDAVVTTGGASRGDEDHVVRIVAERGRLHFWQIAVKPGRPLALGQLGTCTFVGLPGNPVAAMVCFLRFARPVLSVLGGGSWPEPRAFWLPAAFAMRKKAGRREYLRAILIEGPDGRPRAHRIEREGSGIVTSLTEACGLVEVAENVTEVTAGQPVAFLPFSELGVGR